MGGARTLQPWPRPPARVSLVINALASQWYVETQLGFDPTLLESIQNLSIGNVPLYRGWVNESFEEVSGWTLSRMTSTQIMARDEVRGMHARL